MSKVSTLIVEALRALGVASLQQPAEPEHINAALPHYNALLHELSSSFDLLDVDGAAYVHSDQTIGEDFPLAEKYRAGISAMVAIRVASTVAKELSPDTRHVASVGYGLLCGAFQKVARQDIGNRSRRLSGWAYH